MKVTGLIDDESLIIANKGLKIDFLDSSFLIVSANRNSSYENQNSIVSRIDHGKISFIFTGDCDSSCERDLLDEEIDADILKVTHHCSKYGSSRKFMEASTPEAAIIQVGENSYGHPNQECLDNLRGYSIETYRTDANGVIVVESNGMDYKIKKERSNDEN